MCGVFCDSYGFSVKVNMLVVLLCLVYVSCLVMWVVLVVCVWKWLLLVGELVSFLNSFIIMLKLMLCVCSSVSSGLMLFRLFRLVMLMLFCIIGCSGVCFRMWVYSCVSDLVVGSWLKYVEMVVMCGVFVFVVVFSVVS